MQIGSIQLGFGANLNTNKVNRTNFSAANNTNNSHALATDVFVKQNNSANNTSFKGWGWGTGGSDYSDYTKKYDDIEKIVPEEIFNFGKRRPEEAIFDDPRKADIIDPIEDGRVMTYLDKDDKVIARTIESRKHGEKTLIYDPETSKLKTKIDYTYAMGGNHAGFQTIGKRTEYQEDGRTPKYELKYDDRDYKNPIYSDMLTRFDKDGNPDRKYLLQKGISPKIIVWDIDKEGKETEVANFTPDRPKD